MPVARPCQGEGQVPERISLETASDVDPGGNLPGYLTLTFTRASALPITQYPDPVTKALPIYPIYNTYTNVLKYSQWSWALCEISYIFTFIERILYNRVLRC